MAEKMAANYSKNVKVFKLQIYFSQVLILVFIAAR